MNTRFTTTMHTPDGDFTVVGSDNHVLASGWTHDVAGLVALIHPSLRPTMEDVKVVDTGGGSAVLQAALNAVESYYQGDLSAPAGVPVLQQSGEFRMRAWEALRRVEAGWQISYTDFAARAGSPAAVRAAAGACAHNAAALFVPCHRVLRSDGSLGGFRYGIELKRRLLEGESLHAPTDFHSD